MMGMHVTVQYKLQDLLPTFWQESYSWAITMSLVMYSYT